MGYYVTIEDATAKIPAANLNEAYKRMCELNEHDDLKQGGSWGPDGKTKSWFSWMDANYPETCMDARDILECLGFECEIDAETGDLGIYGYDSKTGQEGLFFETIGDLVDGYIEWRGEDGDRWRWLFKQGQPMKSQTARVSWE